MRRTVSVRDTSWLCADYRPTHSWSAAAVTTELVRYVIAALLKFVGLMRPLAGVLYMFKRLKSWNSSCGNAACLADERLARFGHCCQPCVFPATLGFFCCLVIGLELGLFWPQFVLVFFRGTWQHSVRLSDLWRQISVFVAIMFTYDFAYIKGYVKQLLLLSGKLFIV